MTNKSLKVKEMIERCINIGYPFRNLHLSYDSTGYFYITSRRWEESGESIYEDLFILTPDQALEIWEKKLLPLLWSPLENKFKELQAKKKEAKGELKMDISKDDIYFNPNDNTNDEQFTIHDITSEVLRRYHYADGTTMVVKNPQTLYLKRLKDRDSHRVVYKTEDGIAETFYPAPGWKAISWRVKDGAKLVDF